MDSTDYESRRKTQNREAQRRYRQKQKDRASHSQSMDVDSGLNLQYSGTGEEWAANYGLADGTYADYMAFDETGSALDHAADMADLFPSTSHSGESADSYFTMMQHTSYQAPYNQNNSTSSTSPSSSDSSGSNGRGKSSSSKLPKSHAKIHAKVDRMVDELSKVYDFGVEMQLMSPDEQLYGSISSMKTQFHRSINRAAKSSSRE